MLQLGYEGRLTNLRCPIEAYTDDSWEPDALTGHVRF